MKPVKIAMMGMTHGHTRKYYQTLIENKKLDWVASCAQDEEAKKVYELYKTGVPCYLDPEEMYKKHPDIEAVVIASANDRHFEQMKWCAEKGIHILSMKIPSFDMKEYDEMIALCDKAGIVCQIELEMHYNSVVRRLEKLVKEGAVGKIKAVQMTNITLSPVWAFPWQGDPRSPLPRRRALRPSAHLRPHPPPDRLGLRLHLRRSRAEPARRAEGGGHAHGRGQDEGRHGVPLRPQLVAWR